MFANLPIVYATNMFSLDKIKPSVKEQQPIFANFLNEKLTTEACTPYSLYDSFISKLMFFPNIENLKKDLSDDASIKNVRAFTRGLNVIGEEGEKDETQIHGTMMSFSDEMHTAFFANMMKNNKKAADDILESKAELLRAMCQKTSFYLLRNLFYEADVVLSLNNTDEMKVAQRFITFFLRRYNEFISNKTNEKGNEISRNLSKRRDDEEEEEVELSIVDASTRFNLEYYKHQLSFFRRLVLSPIYKEQTQEFIELMVTEFTSAYNKTNTTIAKNLIGDQTESNGNTLDVYYYVLMHILKTMADKSEESKTSTEAFLKNKSAGFFISMPIPFKSTLNAYKTNNICLLLKADAVTDDQIIESLE